MFGKAWYFGAYFGWVGVFRNFRIGVGVVKDQVQALHNLAAHIQLHALSLGLAQLQR